MKFFVDTADLDEIKDLAATGLLDGVTTNPSLIAKSGRDFKEVIKDICAVVDGPVSAEVASTEYDAMLAEANEIRSSGQIRGLVFSGRFERTTRASLRDKSPAQASLFP